MHPLIYFIAGLVISFINTNAFLSISKRDAVAAAGFSFASSFIVLTIMVGIIKSIGESGYLATSLYSLGIALGTFISFPRQSS